MSNSAAANAYLQLCSVIVQKGLLQEYKLPHVTPAHSVARLVSVCIEKKLLSPKQVEDLLPPEDDLPIDRFYDTVLYVWNGFRWVAEELVKTMRQDADTSAEDLAMITTI